MQEIFKIVKIARTSLESQEISKIVKNLDYLDKNFSFQLRHCQLGIHTYLNFKKDLGLPQKLLRQILSNKNYKLINY